MSIRLQTLLAQNTNMSRRAADEAIALGRVKVNGQIALPGTKATASDKIRIDGGAVAIQQTVHAPRVLAYHKAIGEQSSQGVANSVFDNLPEAEQRWLNVGRLDINTSGLLLFVSDGQLAHRLTHPSFAIDREYAVRVYGLVNQTMTNKLCTGVMLEDGDAKFLDLIDCGGGGTNRWFYVVVQQGRNRLVRRLWQSQGVEVSRLIRVRFGSILLASSLQPSSWSELSIEEVNDLYTSVDLSPALATTARATRSPRRQQTSRSTNRTNRYPRLGIAAGMPAQVQHKDVPVVKKSALLRTKVETKDNYAKPRLAASSNQHKKDYSQQPKGLGNPRTGKPHKAAGDNSPTNRGVRRHQDSNQSRQHSTTRQSDQRRATGNKTRTTHRSQRPTKK